MKKTKALVVFWVGMLSAVVSIAAGIPEELVGSWGLNQKLTKESMMAAPDWTPESEKVLPVVFKRMSQVLYGFTEAAVTVSVRGKAQSLPVGDVRQSENAYEVDGMAGNKVVTLTISFIDKDNINIRSSASNDMDYYIWERVVEGGSN